MVLRFVPGLPGSPFLPSPHITFASKGRPSPTPVLFKSFVLPCFYSGLYCSQHPSTSTPSLSSQSHSSTCPALPCPLIAEVVGGDDGNVAQHNHCPDNVTRCHSLREHIILQHRGHHHLRLQDDTPQSKVGLGDHITHTDKGDHSKITTAPTQFQLRGSLGSMGICSRKKPGREPISPTMWGTVPSVGNVAQALLGKPVGSEVGGQDPRPRIGSPVRNQACIVPRLL